MWVGLNVVMKQNVVSSVTMYSFFKGKGTGEGLVPLAAVGGDLVPRT